MGPQTCSRRRAHGQHVDRPSGIALHLAAQVFDMRIDRTIERLHPLAANGIEQLSAREHAAGLPHHRRE